MARERSGGGDRPADFRGNKSSLPRKTCATCGREMVWRKRWADTWETVRYCSERCRRERSRNVRD